MTGELSREVRRVADLRIAAALETRGFAVEADYVPGVDWRALAEESRRLEKRGGFRHAGVGRGASFRIRPEIRSDFVHWIDAEHPTRRQRAWLARAEALRRALNERLLLGLFGFESHLASYPPGARYRTHLDRFADALHRRVSVILYLNEAWQAEHGGLLRLYLDAPDREPWHDVEPAGGTLVAFLSDALHHEVLSATRERRSVVGWFTARP